MGLLLTCIITPSLAADNRVALVIGNAQYQNLKPLANPHADAIAVAQRLKALGFHLIRPIHKDQDAQLDLGLSEFLDAKQAIQDAAKGAELALVYYAGHGMQLGRRSEAHLLPVDVIKPNRMRDLSLLERGTLSLDELLGDLDGIAQLTIAVFDACREIPEMETASRSVFGNDTWRGLARPRSPGKARIVAYSAASGKLAADGLGSNSPYTTQLLRVLENNPKQEVSAVFQTVATAMGSESGQYPELLIQGNVPPRQFYFSKTKTKTKTKAKAPSVVAPAIPNIGSNTTNFNAEIVFWTSLQGSQACGDYQAYLQTYPQGQFSSLARSRRDRFCSIEKPAAASASRPAVILGDMDLRLLLKECAVHLEANRLTSGAGGNALECYMKVLEIRSGELAALRGLTKIEDKYIAWVRRELKRKKALRAQSFLVRLKSVNADREEVGELEEAIAALQASQKQAAALLSQKTQTIPKKGKNKRASSGPEMDLFEDGDVIMSCVTLSNCVGDEK